MVGAGTIIAELLIVLIEEGLELAQIQRDLAAGAISEDEAHKRRRATQEQYAETRRQWDET